MLEYTILIEKDLETGYYVGQILEVPAVLSQGKTINELKNNLKDALKLYLQTEKEEIKKK